MHLSVREALAIEPLTRAKVIAGRKGMDRTIKSITIMDTPDIKNWLKGGEFLLTNVYVIKDNPAAQVALVRDLSDIGVAALGVKLKRFVDRLPWEMLDLADELGLPVIEVPVECSWIEILNPVLTEILHRQAARLEESGRVHDYFTRLALSGKGLQQLCAGLTEITGLPCAVFDESGRVAAQAFQDETHCLDWVPVYQHVQSNVSEATEASLTIFETPEGPVAANTLAAGPDHYGYLLLALRRKPSQTAMTALEHAGTVATLEMAKQRAVLEAEKRFKKDFLIDLLNGDIESREAVMARARSLGNWDFSKPHMIAVVDADGFEQYYLKKRAEGEIKVQKTRDSLIEILSSGARALIPGTVTVEQSDSLTLIIPVDDRIEALRRDEFIRALASRLKLQVRTRLREVTVSIGIGRFYNDLMMWPKAYREARLAIEYGRRIWGYDRVTHYNDLGSYRLIVTHQNPQELWAFADEVLHGLDRCDEDQREQFVETLEAYFRSNRKISATAGSMYVHANTIRHRLKRMEEVIGFDPNSPEHCLNFEMALRIRAYQKVLPKGS